MAVLNRGRMLELGARDQGLGARGVYRTDKFAADVNREPAPDGRCDNARQSILKKKGQLAPLPLGATQREGAERSVLRLRSGQAGGCG